MIGYVTIGVTDMEKAKSFYSELLAPLGASVVLDAGRIAFIGKDMASPMLAVCVPYNEEAPAPGNGNMVAIGPGSKEKVDESSTTRRLNLAASVKASPVSVSRICSTVRISVTRTATRSVFSSSVNRPNPVLTRSLKPLSLEEAIRLAASGSATRVHNGNSS